MKTSLFKSKLFKLQNARQFTYMPLYYDEAKERLEERKKRIARELEREKRTLSEEGVNLKIKFERNHAHKATAKAQKWSSIRLIVILVILLVLFYKVFINLDAILKAV